MKKLLVLIVLCNTRRFKIDLGLLSDYKFLIKENNKISIWETVLK